MIERYRDFLPVVPPDAWVHATALLIGDVVLDSSANIWPGVVLRGDQGAIRIGRETNIQDGSIAHATGGISRTTIGAGCTVGHRALLHGCVVADHCLIGMGAIVLDNAEIGEWCVIGAGAVVPVGARIPPRSLVLGIPGRVVRAVTERDVERIEIGRRTYLALAATYRLQAGGGGTRGE